MQQQVVDVERALRCNDCSYDKDYNLIFECGPCQAKAIEQRIKWWQNGKKELKTRGDYILVGDERTNKV